MNLIAYPAWAFLIGGGVMSTFSMSHMWDRAAAYLVALALLLFVADCILKRIGRSRLIPRR